MDPNGQNNRNISDTAAIRERHPRVDPTGTIAVFERIDATGKGEIWIFFTTQAQTRLTTGGEAGPRAAADARTSWARTRIPTTRPTAARSCSGGCARSATARLGQWDLMTVRSDGTGLATIVSGPAFATRPTGGRAASCSRRRRRRPQRDRDRRPRRLEPPAGGVRGRRRRHRRPPLAAVAGRNEPRSAYTRGMKSRHMRVMAVLIGLVVLAADARAQGLGEAAERERQRQEKVRQGGAAAKVITAEELASNPGKLANDPSIPPAVAAAPLSSRVAKGRRHHSGVDAASTAGIHLFRQRIRCRWAARPRCAAPSRVAAEHCPAEEAEVHGTRRQGHRARRPRPRRQRRPGADVGPQREPDYRRAHGPLARTATTRRRCCSGGRSAPSVARPPRAGADRAWPRLGRTLATLEEGARRQGVPPGWLRE